MTDVNNRAEHVALVWRDERHNLMVAVGEWIWPVVDETEAGDLKTEPRLAETLRQQGWRPIPGAEHDRSERGMVRIPIERIPED